MPRASAGTNRSGAVVHTACPPCTGHCDGVRGCRTPAPTGATSARRRRRPSRRPTVGTSTPLIQGRESNRSTSRPASRICAQSWRPTSSKPHHADSRRSRQPVHLPSAALVSRPSGNAPASRLVPVATPHSTARGGSRWNEALVAHSTSPATRSTVAPPQELGDRPTHRVADRDDAIEAERGGEGGDVVGALLETERLRRSDATAVAAVVEGDDVEVGGQRGVARPPVEVSRRGPAV